MKNSVIVFVFLFICCGIHAQGNALPPEERLMQINDSIVNEGEALYTADIMSWWLTDYFFSRQHEAKEIGGSLVHALNDSVYSALFVNKERDKCIFELRLNVTSDETYVIDSVRPMTENESEKLADRQAKIEKVIEQYRDSMTWISPEEGRFNWDLLYINDQARLYVLQGVTKGGIIPFGNDYSFDFDENNKITKFRRHHKSFLPLPLTMEDVTEVEEIVHSHLRDNPYITATDICNFLLYGMPAGVKSFSVISTYYNCYFKFSFSDGNKITVKKIE